jgi:hypothetical protein
MVKTTTKHGKKYANNRRFNKNDEIIPSNKAMLPLRLVASTDMNAHLTAHSEQRRQ